MSEHTGLVVENMELLLPRLSVLELGHPDPSMPDYAEYSPKAIIPIESRPFDETTDFPWLEQYFLARETTPLLGRMAIIKSPFSPEEFEALQQFAQGGVPTSREAQPDIIRAPIIDIPDDLPAPGGTLPPNSATRRNKGGDTVPNYIMRNPPGMRTSTIINGDPPRRAIHFDSWFYGETGEQRLASPNRLGLNLGPTLDRSVIITEDDIFDIEAASETGLGPGVVDRHFSRQIGNGEKPRALALKIGVREGYILPTEAIGHDGIVSGEYKGPGESWVAFWVGQFAVDNFERVA
ncbi:MAG TPA: hypothetical protein VLF60_03645 [Candidatus Saccharimonadales bacterium]|nr:hypothetical protein [Candidatus Saccharimonadales bacterium]